MVPHPRQRPSALLLILALVDKMPLPNTTPAKARGRRQTYSDRLFLKVGVLMTLKRLGKVHELLAALEEPTSEMHALRHYLAQRGQFPASRTIERCLKRLADLLPAIIAHVGALVVERLGYGAERVVRVRGLLACGFVCEHRLLHPKAGRLFWQQRASLHSLQT